MSTLGCVDLDLAIKLVYICNNCSRRAPCTYVCMHPALATAIVVDVVPLTFYLELQLPYSQQTILKSYIQFVPYFTGLSAGRPAYSTCMQRVTIAPQYATCENNCPVLA